MNKRRITIVTIPILVAVALSIAIVSRYWTIEVYARGKNSNDLREVPTNQVGLVLGCSKYVIGGRPNLYFTGRIAAAADLLKSGKVSYLLVSGDNGTRFYDEPSNMRDALLAAGVPEDRIVLDYAGFRTFDSVVRSKKLFGQDQITIVSQPFHTKRAVFIASRFGIDAFGYNAPEVRGARSLRTWAREVLARFKTVLDLYVLNTHPKFLGDPIQIGETSVSRGPRVEG